MLCFPPWHAGNIDAQSGVSIDQMIETTTFAPSDILYMERDPSGAKLPRKITASNLLSRRGGCSMVYGSDDPTAAFLTDVQIGGGRQCMVPQDATLLQITVAADAGTPSVILRRRRPNGNTTANLTSALLATAANGGIYCSKTTAVVGLDGVTVCSNTLQNTALLAGDWIEAASASAGGTARRMSIAVTWITGP